MGDYQYDCDDAADFAVSYTPTWGRPNSFMDPDVGNHEDRTRNDVYGTPCPADNATAAGYFGYFGAAAHPETNGDFSFDAGSWHIIGMNGNCPHAGRCGASSARTAWLQTDLASTTQPCIAAYWRQPMFTGLGSGKNPAYRHWWDALYAAHADVVLNGHIHDYQRFVQMAPDATPDPTNSRHVGPEPGVVGRPLIRLRTNARFAWTVAVRSFSLSPTNA